LSIILPIAFAGLLGACDLSEWRLADDPSALAPPSDAFPWSREAASDVPGGKATLDSFAGRSPQPAVDASTIYDLPALIDLAQRSNPDTRAAWEEARAAAAKVGVAEGAYLPTISAVGRASYGQLPDYDKTGPFVVRTGVLSPLLKLDWLLIDFGRRKAEVDSAAQTLLAANLQFSREQQTVTLTVQKAYFALEASRARVKAEEIGLKAAEAAEQATGIRARGGLASITDELLARQVVLQLQYDIASARRDAQTAEARLARAIGISPSRLPQIASLSGLPLPQALPGSVDVLLQQMLGSRPDLAAKFAEMRARQAELDRARADYLPTLSASGMLGRVYRELDSLNLGPNGTTFYTRPTTWGVGLELKWELFDGFIRSNQVREAKARRDQAQADFDALQLSSEAEVWTAYADFGAALSQHQLAGALVATTKSAYDSALTGYASGATNIVDLLAAERDYARALATEVDTRSAILAAAAALAYAAGTSGS
jgi:outer membrane protein TolC